VERPLRREVVSVFCQSQPVVICQNVHLIFTLHEFCHVYEIYTRPLPRHKAV
jgi:hypothetical protein